ncbi:hypothetical protein [Jiangella alkaliphila]|uniref:Antitoxin HicB n=1 Tax=Jiangella alkaliphila TaxID=419479 RepID=A0A1H2K2L9_9ACTN|nr:hypothetical protein [Jiangella alkaliphila]SDU62929.1 hypothetical protein SAMN04488563_3354 [Jiangella alkaliphila]
MTTYAVKVVRDEDLWVADIEGLPPSVIGAADYPTLAELHTDLPELIADLAGSDPSDVTISWHYEIAGKDVTAQILGAALARERLERAQREREEAVRVALDVLRGAGLSQRLIGEAVGLTKQRVSQMLADQEAFTLRA